MAKCGCAGGACGCKVVSGRGTQVRGSGAVNDPFRIDAFPAYLSPGQTTTIQVLLTGDGTATNPWILSANTIGSAAQSDQLTFWVGTQSEYDALGVYDDETLYGITGP